MIPVVDLFAGPGGLGEGFAAATNDDRAIFRLALSIEKDAAAHKTLELRAFRRHLDAAGAKTYYRMLSGELTREEAYLRHAKAAAAARAEAWLVEVGEAAVEAVRTRVRGALGSADRWVLIGGPPCQAYSLAGRSRNRGKENYSPEKDARQKLYVEYLQLLADHQPPVFVMENVKGLLSASHDGKRLFDRIREDLGDPARALTREARSSNGARPNYDLYSFVDHDGVSDSDPRAFVIKAESHGIPQARHRVILLGIRRDTLAARKLPRLSRRQPESVADVLQGLPRLRSGITKSKDGCEAWLAHLRAAKSTPWAGEIDAVSRQALGDAIERLAAPARDRGAESLTGRDGLRVWNHSSRGHMLSDLHRYLFAASYAHAHGRSPLLRDFPMDLLPKHQNVKDAVSSSGTFADRFRVQLKNGPSTTITSHIAKDGHYYIHYDPTQCRSLTVREAARLQTFPEDYFFCGTRTEQYVQVGNAVPPKLGKRLAEIVGRILE
jgi:DNA (cytosine-5)-methyltransferase 1